MLSLNHQSINEDKMFQQYFNWFVFGRRQFNLLDIQMLHYQSVKHEMKCAISINKNTQNINFAYLGLEAKNTHE